MPILSAFKQQLDTATVDLESLRTKAKHNRLNSLKRFGIYFDGSPTGTGKSHAAMAAIKRNRGKSLVLVHTHRNAEETVKLFRANGIDAEAFPKRAECLRPDEAKTVEDQGLSFTKVLCPDCPFWKHCPYQEQLKEANEARCAIATHKRAEVTPSLVEKYALVIIEEDPVPLFCPKVCIDGDCGAASLQQLEKVATAVAAMPNCDPGVRNYFERMVDHCHWLHEQLTTLKHTTILEPLCFVNHVPDNVQKILYQMASRFGVTLNGSTVRLVRDAVEGKMKRLVFTHDRGWGREATKVNRSLVAVRKAPSVWNKTVWIHDATGDKAELELILGQPVFDKTVVKSLPAHHPYVQIPEEVRLTTSPKAAAALLTEVLEAIPGVRIGLITHKRLLARLLKLLPDHLRSRIVKADYFRSGMSRGTNSWIDGCDTLVVFGTPRAKVSAYKQYLVQTDRLAAVLMTAKEAGWTKHCPWLGATEDGEGKQIKCSGYNDPQYKKAYRALVHSELKQAAGRGRSSLGEGIPTYVVTKDNIGMRLMSEWEVRTKPRLSAEALLVYETFFDIDRRPKRQKVGIVEQILKASGNVKSKKTIHDHLNTLESVGLLSHEGCWWVPVKRMKSEM